MAEAEEIFSITSISGQNAQLLNVPEGSCAFHVERLTFDDTEAFDLLADGLRDGLRAMGSPSVRETPIVVALLGKDAAAYGALRAAMVQELFWL